MPFKPYIEDETDDERKLARIEAIRKLAFQPLDPERQEILDNMISGMSGMGSISNVGKAASSAVRAIPGLTQGEGMLARIGQKVAQVRNEDEARALRDAFVKMGEEGITHNTPINIERPAIETKESLIPRFQNLRQKMSK